MIQLQFYQYKEALKFVTNYAADHDFYIHVPRGYWHPDLNEFSDPAKPVWHMKTIRRAGFEWDGTNFFLSEGSEEMIIHEIAHYIVALRKRGRHKIKLPEFGLGPSPGTWNQFAAKAARCVSLKRSNYEEIQASLLAVAMAKTFGMDVWLHQKFTNTTPKLFPKQQRSLKRLGLITNDGCFIMES